MSGQSFSFFAEHKGSFFEFSPRTVEKFRISKVFSSVIVPNILLLSKTLGDVCATLAMITLDQSWHRQTLLFPGMWLARRMQ